MLIDLSSHRNLPVESCSSQLTLAIALFSGALKRTIFATATIIYTQFWEGKKNTTTWDSEDTTYWNQQKEQGWALFCLGMHADTHNCEMQYTTKIIVRNTSHMWNILIPTIIYF